MQVTRILNSTVVVGALGYFVDIYDLILFSIVRIPSLRALGVPDDMLLSEGVKLLNAQMFGMLLGGIIWGVLGDKKGRISVLFGSICLYSVANLLNGAVQTVEQYFWLRLIAGIGLAGELGAAITLVSEVMHKNSRGFGTAIVASIGLLGAVAAAWIGDSYDWRIAYYVGGILGLALLILRISIFESGMFEAVKQQKDVSRGNFWSLFYPWPRLKRYLSCIFIGVPIWFVIGVLITFSPELSQAVEVNGVVAASKAVMFGYIGLSVGDLSSGLLSQHFKSRIKIVFAFMLLTLALTFVYVFARGLSVNTFYALCGLLGFGTGYWAMFVTIASEQFGTNLRATATTTVPNFVRGAVVPITLLFNSLKQSFTLPMAALGVGLISFALAFIALRGLEETHGKDLDYIE